MSYQLLIQYNVSLNYFFINLTRLFPADSLKCKQTESCSLFCAKIFEEVTRIRKFKKTYHDDCYNYQNHSQRCLLLPG